MVMMMVELNDANLLQLNGRHCCRPICMHNDPVMWHSLDNTMHQIVFFFNNIRTRYICCQLVHCTTFHFSWICESSWYIKSRYAKIRITISKSICTCSSACIQNKYIFFWQEYFNLQLYTCIQRDWMLISNSHVDGLMSWWDFDYIYIKWVYT